MGEKNCYVCKYSLNTHPDAPCASCIDYSQWEPKESGNDAHYQTSIQPIETMQANMTKEEFIGFLKGNIIKYACRSGRKDAPFKEAEKIRQYAYWLVQAIEGRTIDPRK